MGPTRHATLWDVLVAALSVAHAVHVTPSELFGKRTHDRQSWQREWFPSHTMPTDPTRVQSDPALGILECGLAVDKEKLLAVLLRIRSDASVLSAGSAFAEMNRLG